MSIAALAVIAATILGTSFLSGIFGMAGGMILLGVLLVLLDVPSAMILFGITQLASNGWRAFLWRRHVTWIVLVYYVVGAFVTFAVMRLIAYVPDKGLVYLLIGLLPIMADRLRIGSHMDVLKPGVAVFTGSFVMLMQLLAGAAGSVLDIFFQKSSLDRKGIVATKAVTQVAAHLLRTVYFGSLAGASATVLPLPVYGGAVVLAMVGTTAASFVLHRMSEEGFRQWSRFIILAISAVFMLRGLLLLLGISG